MFGGDCELIGRLRAILDVAKFSDRHLRDTRWQSLRDVVETIEAVLKDLGTFKTWKPQRSTTPQGGLRYRGSRRRFSPARSVKEPAPASVKCESSSSSSSSTPKVGHRMRVDTDKVAPTDLHEAVMQPNFLTYPTFSDLCLVGQELHFAAEVSGGNAVFSVEPQLVEGLLFNAENGTIQGSVRLPFEGKYTVTATNHLGCMSTDLDFKIGTPPKNLTYAAFSELVVGEMVEMVPSIDALLGLVFTVEPELPDGLSMGLHTGVISGVPKTAGIQCAYHVVAANAWGDCTVKVVLQVVEDVRYDVTSYSYDIEAITAVVDLMPEPSKTKAFGDWMVWMVHRVYLNDPALIELCFDNMRMPPAYVEARIAPKLVKAIATNMHLEVLSLSNSNVMSTEGMELAASLRVNNTLKTLNIQCNRLDPTALREIALALAANPSIPIEQLRVTPQEQVDYFGRPVEEAFGQLMDRNKTIVTFGFVCADANWRNMIDRALLRNNDFARRRRTRNHITSEDGVPFEERQLTRLALQSLPDCTSLVFTKCPEHVMFQNFVVSRKQLPTAYHLQNFARGRGICLKYSTIASMITEYRTQILDAARGTEVVVSDIFEVGTTGCLRNWSVKNSNWSLDVWDIENRKCYDCKSTKEPAIHLSDPWASWITQSV